ncbi:unnamed protein product [Gordionus sp. m RMFG-2023]
MERVQENFEDYGLIRFKRYSVPYIHTEPIRVKRTSVPQIITEPIRVKRISIAQIHTMTYYHNYYDVHIEENSEYRGPFLLEIYAITFFCCYGYTTASNLPQPYCNQS